MGIFSHYKDGKKDKPGTHPHNITKHVITAKAGETIIIRVPGNKDDQQKQKTKRAANLEDIDLREAASYYHNY